MGKESDARNAERGHGFDLFIGSFGPVGTIEMMQNISLQGGTLTGRRSIVILEVY